MEVLTGAGLASAAGLNAYLPLLVLGLLARFTAAVPLPHGWTWLTDPWALGVLAVLLAVEVVADKVPGVDHANDVLQTVVRPAAGGIAVGAGSGTHALVASPSSWLGSGSWVPVVAGAALALVVHLTKAASRAAVNATTLGLGAPVVSTLEDVTSAGLALAALLAPLLVLGALVLLVAVAVRALHAARSGRSVRRRTRRPARWLG